MIFKLLASLAVVLNPVVGLFATLPNFYKDSDSNNVPLVSEEQFKLPLEEDNYILPQRLPIFPTRDWNVPEPEISAKTALVFDTAKKEILYQKNGLTEQKPIASLTKLMTALVVLENADFNSVFSVSQQAVETEGKQGSLRVNEQISAKNLLHALLVESSNDAAVALAENVGSKFLNNSATENSLGEEAQKIFIDLMNKKAEMMNLKNTEFADPSGLSPQNYSCAWDIAKMLQAAALIPLLREIMQTKTINLSSADGKFDHHLANTNQLLSVIPGIIGGKTGYTEEAGNCMALATKTLNGDEMLIFVIMDAKDRSAEIKTLFEWTKKAFLW